ncbi:MAG: hypothetical protein EA361_11200 [Bacteroidetes bacterium]|nr:MAG: hypothetical protein EA361_11200 [Bacteroidota bacterium]
MMGLLRNKMPAERRNTRHCEGERLFCLVRQCKLNDVIIDFTHTVMYCKVELLINHEEALCKMQIHQLNKEGFSFLKNKRKHPVCESIPGRRRIKDFK